MNFLPENLQDLRNVQIDPVVLVFTAIITLGTGLLFGVAPALQGCSISLSSAMNQGNGMGPASSGRSILLRGFVSLEVALGLVLLLGAGLLLNSLIRLQSDDPGFDSSNLIMLRLPLSKQGYADSLAQNTFLSDVTTRIRQLPGIVSVATGSGVPPHMDIMISAPVLGEEDPTYVSSTQPFSIALVSPEYFATLRMRFVEGRGFTEAELFEGSSPVVVNEYFARTHWREPNVVGQRFRLGRDKSWYRVVGVVQDVASMGLGTSHDRAQFFFTPNAFRSGDPALIVRTSTDPLDMVHLVKQQIWSVNPYLPLSDIGIVERMLSDSIARQRFNAMLLSVFALLALALLAIGVFGVISLGVRRRTKEIGVRIALGAKRMDIAKMVAGFGLRPIVWGLFFGVAGSLAATHAFRSLLFEIQPTDPFTYVTVILFVSVIGLVAAYVPSHRAATIDPLKALREE
jgi:putative ABC transport system permease protein